MEPRSRVREGEEAAPTAMRRLMAPICVAAVLGGLAAWFFHSALYRSLDPLQVPRVLLLYVLPERYFTPMDVVIWGTTQSIRGDSKLIDKIEANPVAAPKPGVPIVVKSPGRWTVRWSNLNGYRVGTFTGVGSVQESGGQSASWNQAFAVYLKKTALGWKVYHVTDIYSRETPLH